MPWRPSCNVDGGVNLARWWRRSAANVDPPVVAGAATGVLGSPWRAVVRPWGDVHPKDGSSPLRWFVAADDRWHHPDREAAVRQRLVDGVPVIETRMRVPRGDVVQTVWSTTVGDVGATVIDVSNESALPVAVALTRTDLITFRPTTSSEEWPAPGLDLPNRPLVVPIGHRSSARVVLRHDGRVDSLPAELPDVESVMRGWSAVVDRGGRLVVPDLLDGVPLGERVTSARCQAILLGDHAESAAERLLDLDERVRANVEVADPVFVVGRIEEMLDDMRRGRLDHTTARLAVTAASRLFGDDERARADLVAAVARVRGCRADDMCAAWGDVEPVTSLAVSRHVLPALVHDRLARLTARDTVTLLPDGMPNDWLGVSCEAHGIAVGDRHTVSFAVRWHGERPAVLWEIDGPAGFVLRSGVDPSWSSSDVRGEALWTAPSRPKTSLAVSDQSFS